MTVSPQTLRDGMLDARARTLALVDDLRGDRWIGPELEIVNPPLWEIGHVAWFTERWLLRHALGRVPLLASADAAYDSIAVEHHSRWAQLLPPLERARRYLDQVLAEVLERLDQAAADPAYAELAQLALLHEDMHTEALLYTRQTLGDPAPKSLRPAPEGGGALPGDVLIPGGTCMLGAGPHVARFVFDNERGQHPVAVAAFRLARAPVTEGEFAAFVEDDGYGRDELWCEAGRTWRQTERAERPVYWRRDGGEWWVREFDRWRPLRVDRPMMHVNWFEAQAFCRWAGRRLPTEAEWELAACGVRDSEAAVVPCVPWHGEWSPERAHVDMRSLAPVDVGACPAGDTATGLRQMLGNVWEWTASTFEPYPGFQPGVYREYSEPWFGTRKVLRGGSFATQRRLLWNSHRNFFTPDRRDVFVGFRTAQDV